MSGSRAQGTLAAAAALVVVGVAGCAPGGVTPDGKHVYFETVKPLVGSDDDTTRDVYERFNGRTTLISQGPAGDEPGDSAAQFLDTSSDGKRVFFSTQEKLVNGDDDGTIRDVYMRSGNKTKLISQGPSADVASDASFQDTDSRGRVVIFGTEEGLVAGDTDGNFDLYAREGKTTRLVGVTSSVVDPAFRALLDGGELVIFETSENLVGADGDANAADVYSWRDGNVRLLSQDPDEILPNTAPANFEGASADGSRVFFATVQDLDAGDGDAADDIYERKGNRTTLISVEGGDDRDASSRAVSADGRRVLFTSEEELLNADDDGTQADLYLAESGDLKLISQGPDSENAGFPAFFAGASASLGTVSFDTREPLVDGDTDNIIDLFTRTGGKTDWVSQGPAGTNESLAPTATGISKDGKRVFFETEEVLVGADEDGAFDVYRRAGGKTTLISRGSGNNGNDGFDAGFLFASASGGKVFFFTGEKLVSADDEPSGVCEDDEDPACSGYERSGNRTTLITRGN